MLVEVVYWVRSLLHKFLDKYQGCQGLVQSGLETIFFKPQTGPGSGSALTLNPEPLLGSGLIQVYSHDEPAECDSHWNCLPDLGVGVFMGLMTQLIWRHQAQRHWMYGSDTRHDNTWSPYSQ